VGFVLELMTNARISLEAASMSSGLCMGSWFSTWFHSEDHGRTGTESQEKNLIVSFHAQLPMGGV
jgi:hypothetical protein